MQSKRFLTGVSAVFLLTTLMSWLTLSASVAPKYKILYRFAEAEDGGEPYDGLILDAAGNLYGTAFYGGAAGLGTVYQLSPNADGTWKETVLYSPIGFEALPNSVTLDSSGNLYGTLVGGVLNGGVFLLTPDLDETWTETEIFDFPGGYGAGSDGMVPSTALTLDRAGNLYGATFYGGNGGCYRNWGCGTIYKLTRDESGSWTETVLYRFSGGKDGSGPGRDPSLGATSGKLVFDSAGNLYGTTVGGGAYGYGVIFRLTPKADGTWTERVLHSFSGGSDGANPEAQLTSDKVGNLFGTTYAGGAYNCGVLFEMQPAGSKWNQRVLHTFDHEPSCNPVGSVTFDTAGALYGVTLNSSQTCYTYSCGTLFKMIPKSVSGWSFRVLHVFTGADDGASPNGTLALDPHGNLFGTTINGGIDANHLGWGTVFEITAH